MESVGRGEEFYVRLPNWEIWGESSPHERLGVTWLLSYGLQHISIYFHILFSCT